MPQGCVGVEGVVGLVAIESKFVTRNSEEYSTVEDFQKWFLDIKSLAFEDK